MFYRIKVILGKDLKQLLRNRSTYLWLLLFPLLLVTILGNVLSSQFGISATAKQQVKVLYLKSDDQLASHGIKQFSQKADSSLITFKPIGETKTAKKRVTNGQATAWIRIKEKHLQVFTHNSEQVQNTILTAYLNQFLNQAALGTTLKSKIADNQQPKMQVKIIKKQQQHLPSAFQYYLIAMIGMNCLLAVGWGTDLFAGERRNKTWQRIKSTPVSNNEFLIGKVGANLIIRSLALLFLMLIGHFWFAVNWGTAFGSVFLAYASLMLFSLLFGAAIDVVSNGSEVVDGVVNMGMQVLIFVGGGYIPVSDRTAAFSPLGWVLKTVRNAVYGGQTRFIWHSIVVNLFLSMLCVFVILGWIAKRGMKNE